MTTAPSTGATTGAATATGAATGLAARGITVGYDRTVLDELSLALTPGKVTALIGPNACGKSTLLKALARLHPVSSGTVLLDRQDIQRIPTREVARRLGILPQGPRAPEGITVADLVWRGRHPHTRFAARRSARDEEEIARALLLTDTAELADRPVDALSGGQRQRVWIAMALAQKTSLLLLDEPTTYLDVAHQLDILDLLWDLNQQQGTSIVLVLHDLNQAARYADDLVAMRDGAVVARGRPADILTEDLVHRVFGVRSRILTDPDAGTPLVLPRGRHDVLAKPGT